MVMKSLTKWRWWSKEEYAPIITCFSIFLPFGSNHGDKSTLRILYPIIKNLKFVMKPLKIQ